MALNGDQLQELANIIGRHAPHDGRNATALRQLRLARHVAPSSPHSVSQDPTFSLLAQGSKSIEVGGETFQYRPGHYAVVSVDLPVIAEITEASPERPLLGMALVLSPDRIRSVLDRVPELAGRQAGPARGFGLTPLTPQVLEATVRLLRLLDAPADIGPLGDLLEQELLYRLLSGPHGPRLIQSAAIDSPGNRVSRAIAWLRSHYREPLRNAELARAVGMSVSSLHQHFKAITALSPMQYQKLLRLNEARRLLLMEGYDVGTAASAVGYGSRNQFGLEYTRHFGHPPSFDALRGRPWRDAEGPDERRDGPAVIPFRRGHGTRRG